MTAIASVCLVTLAAIVCRGLVLSLHKGYFRHGISYDAAIHYAIIRQLKKDPHSTYIDQYVIRHHPISYPLIFHRYCTLYPLSWIKRYSFVPSYVVYAVSVFAIFSYFTHIEAVIFGSVSWRDYWLLAFVFFLSPTNWIFNGPNIAYITLSERQTARVVTAAFFLFAFLGQATGDPWTVGLAAAAAALAMGTAIFARQTLLFVTPVFCLLVRDATPILEVGVGILLNLLLSRKHFLLGMRHMFESWRLYASLHKKSPNAREMLVNFLSKADILRMRGSKFDRIRLPLRREPLNSLVRYPEIVFAVMVSISAVFSSDPTVSGIGRSALALVVTALIVYVTTTFDRFNHLGESYRYLEYALFFVAPTSIALLAGRVGQAATVSGFYWLAFVVTITPLLCREVFYNGRYWPERDHLGEFLEKWRPPSGAVILPMDIQTAGNICARRDDVKSFWYQPGFIAPEVYEDYIDVWPFFKRDPGAIILRHGVTHALCDKSLLSRLPWPFRLPGMRRVLEDDHFIAFERVAPGGRNQDIAVEEVIAPASPSASV